jgi:hypothetical protein
MIDHKTCRLGGNPAPNLIVPTAFYVAEVQKLGDDNAFLRICLWPTLQALYRSEDIEQFRERYPESEVEPTVGKANVFRVRPRSTTTDTMEGEGTYGP